MITGKLFAFLSAVTTTMAQSGDATNQTDLAGGTGILETDQGMSTELKVCIGIAVICTVVGIIACCVIRMKSGSESNRAYGDNRPKVLGGKGMPDDI